MTVSLPRPAVACSETAGIVLVTTSWSAGAELCGAPAAIQRAHQIDLILRKIGWAVRGHAHADGGVALNFLHEVAGVGIAGVDAHEARHFGARHVDQQRVTIARIEPQSLRRVGALMAAAADGREYRVLDFLEIVVSGRTGRHRTAACIEPGSVPRRSSPACEH